MDRHASLRAVIFDLDGLMADSEPLALWAWQQTLARFGHHLDEQTFREVLGMRVTDSARYICERFSLPVRPDEALAERERLFLEAVPMRLQACPGLYPLLDELAAREIPLGIGTSGHREYVALALQALGLEGRFQAIAAGDEVARGKPAPDIYLLAAERLGIPPARCLVLEDALLGVEAACAAGMVCVAVPNEWTSSFDFPGTYRVLDSLHEVVGILDDLFGDVNRPLESRPRRYVAAGGVVVDDGRVLVLRRPSRGEVRLPKGHVEPGEGAQAAALREVREEGGCDGLKVEADLGAQVVGFESGDRRVVRIERYFLMRFAEGSQCGPLGGEEQFEPVWLPWDEALAILTYETEREWVRRARAAWERDM